MVSHTLLTAPAGNPDAFTKVFAHSLMPHSGHHLGEVANRGSQALPAFTGRASKSIRRLLAHYGARLAASPESFLVKGLTGALAEGELGRARAWGERLSGVTASEAPPGRRQAS